MIFEAFIVPTPRRIKKFFESSIYEKTIDMKKDSNLELNGTEEKIDKSKVNIEASDYSVKKLGFSVKIF